MHLQTQRVRRHHKLKRAQLPRLIAVRHQNVGKPRVVHYANVRNAQRPIAGQRVGTGIRAQIGIARIHALAGYRQIIRPGHNVGLAGVGHQQILLIARLLHLAPAVKVRWRITARPHIGQGVLLQHQQGFAHVGAQLQPPTRQIRRHHNRVIRHLAPHQTGIADHPVRKTQTADRDGHVRPDTPAHQCVVDGIHPGAADHAHVVGPCLQRVAHAHLQYLTVSVNAVVIIIIGGPVIVGHPLIAAGPGGRVLGIPTVRIALRRQLIPAHVQIRVPVGRTVDAQIPSKGIRRHRNAEILPLPGGLGRDVG